MASEQMNAKDFKLALAVGVEKIGAQKVHHSVSETHRWAYWSDDTVSWWLVTAEALVQLADMDLTKWEESDSTAEQYGKRRPKWQNE